MGKKLDQKMTSCHLRLGFFLQLGRKQVLVDILSHFEVAKYVFLIKLCPFFLSPDDEMDDFLSKLGKFILEFQN